MKSADMLRTAVRFGTEICFVVGMSASGGLALGQTQPVPPAATSPVTPPATASPAPMPPSGQAAAVVEPSSGTGTAAAAGSLPTSRIYMPDGQLKSHSIRVYVTRDILPDQTPRLRLLRSHAVTKKAVDETTVEEPGVVAPGQEWIESVEGQQVRRSGTLLLFDISNRDFGYGAMRRVMPVLSWTEGGIGRIAVGEREVNVGNIVAALWWTASIVGLALLVVVALSWQTGVNPLLLLTGVDGHLSLAQTQIACWTVAVGSVVLGYGLIRLEIPNIPESVLVLMGASLATGGFGFYQDAQKQQAAVKAGVGPARRNLALGDLVRVFSPGQAPELSLAKAQMLFWTILLLVLFVSKSILGGAIWEVPWALVALMGFSQAGYLVPKLASQP